MKCQIPLKRFSAGALSLQLEAKVAKFLKEAQEVLISNCNLHWRIRHPFKDNFQ